VTPAKRLELEILMDEVGIESLLDEAQTICAEKALHVDQAYNDRQLTHKWEAIGNSIQRCLKDLRVQGWLP
jgi:hypothetical protein